MERMLSAQTALGWAVGSCFLTLTGPFGTYGEQDLIERALFWSGTCALSILVAYTVHALGLIFAASMDRLFVVMFEATGFAALFTPVLFGFIWLFPDQRGPPAGYSYEQIGLLSFMAFLLVWIARDQLAPAVDRPMRPRLCERLGLAPEVKIIRLMAEGHHVVVFGSDGIEHRLRLRLADAVREMDGAWGTYAHRSHWIDFDHILEVGRDKGRDMLLMSDGATVPVSRTYRPAFVDAGFLTDAAAHPVEATGSGQRAGP